MKVLKIETGIKPYEIDINPSLENLQAEVNGFIECIYPWNDEVCIIANEEGKINGMELNRALRDESGSIFDIIAGPFLIVGLTEDDFCSLSEEQVIYYSSLFRKPETFIVVNGKVYISNNN